MGGPRHTGGMTTTGSTEESKRKKQAQRSLEEQLDWVNYAVKNAKNHAFLDALIAKRTGKGVKEDLHGTPGTPGYSIGTRGRNNEIRNLLPAEHYTYLHRPHIDLHVQEVRDKDGEKTGDMKFTVTPPPRNRADFAITMGDALGAAVLAGCTEVEFSLPPGKYTADQAFEFIESYLNMVEKLGLSVTISDKTMQHYGPMFNAVDVSSSFTATRTKGFMKGHTELGPSSILDMKDENGHLVRDAKYRKIKMTPSEYIERRMEQINNKHNEHFLAPSLLEKSDARLTRDLNATDKFTAATRVPPLPELNPGDPNPALTKTNMKNFMLDRLKDAGGIPLVGDAKLKKMSEELGSIEGRMAKIEAAYEELSERYKKLSESHTKGTAAWDIQERMLDERPPNANHTLKLLDALEREYKDLKNQQIAWKEVYDNESLDGTPVTVANPAIKDKAAAFAGKDPKTLSASEKNLQDIGNKLGSDDSFEKRLGKLDINTLKTSLTNFAATIQTDARNNPKPASAGPRR